MHPILVSGGIDEVGNGMANGNGLEPLKELFAKTFLPDSDLRPADALGLGGHIHLVLLMDFRRLPFPFDYSMALIHIGRGGNKMILPN